MAPIRVGFIGLGSGQAWSVWAHLPYLKSSPKYEIVALCNSSVERAQAAIKTHELPNTVKAYGSAEEIANDPDIDLIVCSVRVDKHYDALLPSIKAGKDVFCEWPLAKDAKQAEEMLAVAKEKKVKTLVGLQAHQASSLRKIKQIIDSGKIGRVLSSTFHGTPRFYDATVTESAEYSHERSYGGNMLTIYTMHSLESIQYVLGDITDFHPLLAISYPESTVKNAAGETVGTMKRTAHDQIMLQGSLGQGAVFSYHLRGGPAFNNADGCFWRIYGEKGEIQITGGDSYLHISDDNVKINVFDHASGETETVAVDKDAFSELPIFSRNVARLYDGFADGKGEQDGVLGWDFALKRHQFVDKVYEKAGVPY
ncbi:NAD-P-binding protein [Polyplosphaeria fusca]|uniref:NAD-P-binding protein n=1 Tax=Polyplosphaeria fusca TaxID=682080 RepID=A0A9P4QPH0_9PLEO|nr:NAD-P-binding protein [Polyplosphaeria fusca]